MSGPGSALRAGARPAVEAALSLAATVGILAALGHGPGALVLGGVLAMSLSRNRLLGSWRGRAEAVVALPVVALATAGVGILLARAPIAGAAVFVGGMFLSVWLRRFGPTGLRLGSLLALPFVTLLITPGATARQEGVLGVILVSLIALGVSAAVRLLADAVLRRPAIVESQRPSATPSTLRPAASTRMAIQLAVALAVAFAAGFLLFPDHWGWVVLTAFLVCSGNRGRADVLHKSGLRVVGAAIGTLVAFLAGGHSLGGPPLVIVVIVLVAVGLWARYASYAWWALIVTVVLSLLQSALGGAPIELVPRLLAILLGAVLGLAASWFLLPVRSLGVLRRRIADLLALLGERAAGEIVDTAPAIARVNEVAPAFVALSRVPFTPAGWRAPARWVALAEQAARLLPEGAASGEVRRAIGEARRAVREPERLVGALEDLLTVAGMGR